VVCGNLQLPMIKKFNRWEAKTAKRGKVWCFGCDKCLISETGKCPICGSRLNRKKIKQKVFE
jgi:rRNA maturation endonuclease Nob1